MDITAYTTRDKLTHEYAEWLAATSFEAMLTVRLPPNLPISEAHGHYIKHVLTPLAKHLKTRLAAISVIRPRTGDRKQHLHSLVVSHAGNLNDTTFAYEGLHYLQSLKNEIISHPAAVDISPVFDLTGACKYVAGHLDHDSALLIPYNQWLLAKNQRSSTNESKETCH